MCKRCLNIYLGFIYRAVVPSYFVTQVSYKTLQNATLLIRLVNYYARCKVNTLFFYPKIFINFTKVSHLYDNWHRVTKLTRQSHYFDWWRQQEGESCANNDDSASVSCWRHWTWSDHNKPFASYRPVILVCS